MKITPLFFFAAVSVTHADPQLSSWLTDLSGRYARIYQTDAAKTAGNASTTWSRGTGTQSQPTYAGVSEVAYSTDWIYLRTTGLGFHVMGPWYLDAGRAQNFPNFPSNTATLYRFPRHPAAAATKTLTGLGAIGYFVDGVALFDNRDSFSYSNSNGKDADPVAGIGNGDGIWTRDAYVNEGVTFDAAFAHQAGNQYHYHANSPALRYELGDHVDYVPATKSYAESTAAPQHSPILAWVRDGYPLYGPYGYASAMDPNSGLKRMASGYVKRDGTHGTTNLAATGRTTLPKWAQLAQNRGANVSGTSSGPAVNATYVLGHYLEDFDFLGDLTNPDTQQPYVQGQHFDLDYYNGRFCVTPEFPQGTYAYFMSIESDGTPKFPYNVGRWFYGNPTGSTVTSITETVTIHFKGGPDKVESWAGQPAAISGSDVTLSWNSVEGGTYAVEATGNMTTWTTLGSPLTATGETSTVVDTGAAANTRRFYKVTRNSLAGYDSNGFDTTNTGTGGGGGGGGDGPVSPASGNRGTLVNLTITIPTTATPPVPPANIPLQSVTIGGSATGISGMARPSQYVITCAYSIPAGTATGAKNVVVTFPGPGGQTGPSYTLTAAFTVN